MYDESLVKRTIPIHKETYGSEPSVVAYAPGRIEVLGNHTDYNLGTTLSCAINMGHCFTISPSSQSGVRLTAGDLRKTTLFDPFTSGVLPKDVQWANYVKGVIHLMVEHRIFIDRIDCTFFGSIPMGSGLSSSAALEMATAFAALDYMGTSLDLKDVAKLGQRAEHEFAGCSCGLLDQFSSIYGTDHGLIHSDFSNLETAPVKLPDEAMFLLVNPHVKHALADSPYNQRRASCERAAKELDALSEYTIKSLRDIPYGEFQSLKGKIHAEAAQRAEHVVGEIYRVELALELLVKADLEGFGQLLYQSHASSKDLFENSCAELDTVVDIAKASGALGARLSGGGFGGSAIVLVREQDAESLKTEISDKAQQAGLKPTVMEIKPSAGAKVVYSKSN
jgi:galactokinase